MNHAPNPNAPKATPISYPDHFATEPDNTALYIPKSHQGQTSFQQTGFVIPPNVDGPVLNHMRVVMCASAILTDRRRSYEQLVRMADAGDEQAQAALDAITSNSNIK